MSTADPLDIVLVYRTVSSVEAHSLADWLDGAGVESQIVGDFLDGAYAGINFGRMGEKEVWVAAKDEATAASLIDDWRREHVSVDVESPRGLPWWLSGVRLTTDRCCLTTTSS